MEDFIDYCFEFYGKGGFYDLKATHTELERAYRIRRLFDRFLPFDGDSFDREWVRDILLEGRA